SSSCTSPSRLTLCRPARDCPDANRKYQQAALKQVLPIRVESEDRHCVEANRDGKHTDQGADDVELSIAEDSRPEERRSERVQQIAVAGVDCGAPGARGEQNAGDGGANRSNHERNDANAVDANARKTG